MSLTKQWNSERKWLAHLKQTNPAHYARVESDFERTWFAKFESVLDGGSCGPLWLRDERVAGQLADSFHHRDGRVYRLDAYSIMPNHAHVVFKPLPLSQADDLPSGIEPSDPTVQTESLQYHSLASIMQSLKGYTAFEANRLLGREGEFWAHESYDHYVRDADEWHRIVAYV